MSVSKFLEPIELREFDNGLIRQSVVDDLFLPAGAVTEAVNVNFDRLGSISRRLGETILGAQIINSSVLGLYYFRSSTSSYSQALTAVNDHASSPVNSDIYYLLSGTWTKTLENWTKDKKVRFAIFLNKVIAVNGYDNAYAWDGNAAWSQYAGTTSGYLNLDDMDSYKCSMVEVMASRVYMAGNPSAPKTLYFSSIPNSTTYYITFTPTTDFVSFLQDNDPAITAIKRFVNTLLVFTDNCLYRYNCVSGTEPDPFIKVGTPCQESVIEAKDGIYFFHSTGIYKYAGDYPVEISRPIADFIEAVPSSFYSSVCSWTEIGGDRVCFSIGDVTVSGVSYTNVVIRYTISSKLWTVYSIATEIRIGADYDDGTNKYALVGDNAGKIYKWATGNSDNGTAISYKMITKWYEIGGISNHKILQELSTICEKAQGIKLQYQTDDNTNWEDLSQLNAFITTIRGKSIGFHRIRFKIYGISSSEPFVYQGVIIERLLNEGIIK